MLCVVYPCVCEYVCVCVGGGGGGGLATVHTIKKGVHYNVTREHRSIE